MRWLARQWWKLIRFGFRLLYNEFAFTYDLVSNVVSLGAWQCWQRTSLKYLEQAQGKRVLEIAHGTGNLHIDLKAAGYSTVGLDLSPNMGLIARRKLIAQGYDAVLVRGRAQHLSFAPGCFDAVVITFPTPFIFEGATLQEIGRVLSDNGTLVIVLNGQFAGSSVIQRFLEWLYQITGQRADHQDGIMDEIHMLFADNGFEITIFQEPCPRSFAQVILAAKHSGVGQNTML